MLGDMLGVAMTSQRTVDQLWQVVQSLGQVHLPTLAISALVVARHPGRLAASCRGCRFRCLW